MAAIFFQASGGALDQEADPECQPRKGWVTEVVQAVTVGLACAFVADGSVVFLGCLHKDNLWCHRFRHLRVATFWLLASLEYVACTLVVSVFLANVSQANSTEWLHSFLMSVLEEMVLMPLAIATALALAASLVLCCRPRVAERVQIIWEGNDWANEEQEDPAQELAERLDAWDEDLENRAPDELEFTAARRGARHVQLHEPVSPRSPKRSRPYTMDNPGSSNWSSPDSPRRRHGCSGGPSSSNGANASDLQRSPRDVDALCAWQSELDEPLSPRRRKTRPKRAGANQSNLRDPVSPPSPRSPQSVQSPLRPGPLRSCQLSGLDSPDRHQRSRNSSSMYGLTPENDSQVIHVREDYEGDLDRLLDSLCSSLPSQTASAPKPGAQDSRGDSSPVLPRDADQPKSEQDPEGLVDPVSPRLRSKRLTRKSTMLRVMGVLPDIALEGD
eukprot:gb/GFBE01075096.1/.p1 GENE.gb/GFBE01075096.1/~~gb/GFBE01075096.1/.p1  ORF type:complete len:444 (+),score=27.22 gb/GFBE01075096.1/:1-1332(+)